MECPSEMLVEDELTSSVSSSKDCKIRDRLTIQCFFFFYLLSLDPEDIF